MAKIRKGDEIIVRAGKDKGKRGTVLSVTPDDRVVVEGINLAKRHVKPNPQRGTGGGGVAGETEFNLLPLRQGEAMSIASSAAAGASIELTDSELKELRDVVERFAWLAEDLSDRILEIEANPIIITGGRAVAVDALAVAKDEIGEN